MFLHLYVFDRLSRSAGHMTMVFASFGVALVLRHLVTLIWGSDWTFTHRGITSKTETKYIATGWLDYI